MRDRFCVIPRSPRPRLALGSSPPCAPTSLRLTPASPSISREIFFCHMSDISSHLNDNKWSKSFIIWVNIEIGENHGCLRHSNFVHFCEHALFIVCSHWPRPRSKCLVWNYLEVFTLTEIYWQWNFIFRISLCEWVISLIFSASASCAAEDIDKMFFDIIIPYTTLCGYL